MTTLPFLNIDPIGNMGSCITRLFNEVGESFLI